MIQNGELRISEVKRVGRKYWWVLPLTVTLGVGIALVATTVLAEKIYVKNACFDRPTHGIGRDRKAGG